MVDCDTLSVKRGESYLKLIEIDFTETTEEIEDLKLISKYMLMTREQFEENLDKLKTASTKKFNILIEYTERVETWLVIYVKKK